MKRTTIALLTISIFTFYYLMITGSIPSPIRYSSQNHSFLFFYILCSIPTLILLYIIHKKDAIKAIGLRSSILQGSAYAVISVLPMLAYTITMGRWDTSISLWYLINATIIAGFFEEFFFRGLLFGQLFRYAQWGFIPAIFIVSLIFGLGHISQGIDITSSVLAGIVTGLGGVLFGWIYVETNYNLWYSISLVKMQSGVPCITCSATETLGVGARFQKNM